MIILDCLMMILLECLIMDIVDLSASWHLTRKLLHTFCLDLCPHKGGISFSKLLIGTL